MVKSCVFVLLLGAFALVAGGDEDTMDRNATDATNTTIRQPHPSNLVVMFLVTTNNTQGHPANGTVIDTVLDATQGNISDPAGPSDVVLITTLQIPEDNDTENVSNITAELGNAQKRMDEDRNNRLKRSVDSETPLVRKKRTFHKKHKGGCGLICELMPPIMMKQPVYHQQQPPPCYSCGPQHPRPQPEYYPPVEECDPCKNKQQHYHYVPQQQYTPPQQYYLPSQQHYPQPHQQHPQPHQHHPQPQPAHYPTQCGGGPCSGGGHGTFASSSSSASAYSY